MIGLIVSGHGGFASGITRGVKLIIGEPQQYEAVDFTEQDSVDDLEKNLRKAAEKLKDCEGILFLTDLTGGSPFNVSSKLKMEADGPRMEVMGGASVPAVIEACMSRDGQDDVQQLAKDVLETGRENMALFAVSDSDCDEYEE